MADLLITENPQFSRTIDGVTTETWVGPQTFSPRYQMFLNKDSYLKTETDKLKWYKYAAPLAVNWSVKIPYTLIEVVEGIPEADVPYVCLYIPVGTTMKNEQMLKKAAGFMSDVDIDGGTNYHYMHWEEAGSGLSGTE